MTRACTTRIPSLRLEETSIGLHPDGPRSTLQSLYREGGILQVHNGKLPCY
jgi:hypothetical protein